MRTADYKKAIKTIIDFKKVFDKINPKIPRKLLGEIGEFYVLSKLNKLGFGIEHKGGKSRYDIYISEIDKKIEVRTSLLKNEGVYPDSTVRFWGWKVENINQRGDRRFDYLIGVALNDDFSKPRFYIFNYKEAFSVGDVNIGRFGNIKKKIHLFENKQSYKKAIKLKPKLISSYERKINRYPARFLNKWDKIE